MQRLSQEYGLNGQTQQSQFTTSPGYEFRRDEGMKAVDRGAAARGLLGSGAAVKAEQRFADGLASSEYDSYWNRLAGLAGVGQAATGSTAAAGEAATSGISKALGDAGNARASSYANVGASVNNGINNALAAYLQQGSGGFNYRTPGYGGPYG